MKTTVARRFGQLTLAGLGLIVLATTTVCADERDLHKDLDEVKARLEKLENQNDLLKKQNEYLQQIIENGLRPPEGEGPTKGHVANPKTVEEIAAEYLKAQEEQKKRAAEQAKADAEAAGHVVGSDLSFKASWKDGFVVESPHKDFRAHVGGRIHQDWGWGHGDKGIEADLGTIEDGAFFRRLRLRVDGRAYEIMEWVAEVDFAGGVARPTDVYMDLTLLPLVGTFRAGHFKEPFSLDELISDNCTTFMERNLTDEAFAPARNIGMMLTDAPLDQRMTWAIGLFRPETDPQGSDFGDGELAYTGRLTFLPWYENEGRCLLHLGVAASHQMQDNEDGNFLRFRAEPELRAIRLLEAGVQSPPFFVDTGELLADHLDLVGLEAALVIGPFSVQGEYVLAAVSDAVTRNDGLPHGDATFQGWYVQATYTLTGEHRLYNLKRGALDCVVPFENFFFVKTGEGSCWGNCCFGKGAWELAARYSHLDLTDSGIEGGRLDDITLGINWYLNPNARIMCNYILALRDGRGPVPDGQADLLGLRFIWFF